VRIATAIAGGLALAAAAMAALAFTAGDGDAPVARKATTTATQATATQARTGLAVWVAQGCGSCHALAAANAHGTFGPDLGSSLAGKPAASIRKSILAPSAHAAAGYETGMMPEDYAARIAPRDLDRLVAFLRAGAR
jgi:mono/diheme cytochrome c family protein